MKCARIACACGGLHCRPKGSAVRATDLYYHHACVAQSVVLSGAAIHIRCCAALLLRQQQSGARFSAARDVEFNSHFDFACALKWSATAAACSTRHLTPAFRSCRACGCCGMWYRVSRKLCAQLKRCVHCLARCTSCADSSRIACKSSMKVHPVARLRLSAKLLAAFCGADVEGYCLCIDLSSYSISHGVSGQLMCTRA